MSLVRRFGARFGGGLVSSVLVAGAAVQACATGSAFVDPIEGDEGGLVEEGGRTDAPVITPKDSGPGEDTGPTEKDSGGGGCTGKVVINELQTGSASNANDEFVELFNPNSCAVALNGWSLKYQSSAGGAGGAGYTFKAGDSIAANGFFLVASSTLPGAKNGTLVNGFAADKGQVGLVDDKSVLVDGVAYGSVTGGDYKEGTAATAPSAGGSIGRKTDGLDTNDNKSDFTAMTPSPGAPN